MGLTAIMIREASERDFRIVLVTDAVSQIYKRSLQELMNIGINLLNSAECLAKAGRSVVTYC